MKMEEIFKNYKNYIFIGEAGSGKSEIALNISKYLTKIQTEKEIHFFDMDMTKPLFRSRDVVESLKDTKVDFHFQEQFMDAPTLVGGVRNHLLNKKNIVVMDVGGSDIGAKSIGGFASLIKREDTVVFYVINPYRIWSDNIEHIDGILSDILRVSHIEPKKLKIISNPNIGKETRIKDIIEGHKKLKDLIENFFKIELLCVSENLYEEFKEKKFDINDTTVFPIKRYLVYPWEE